MATEIPARRAVSGSATLAPPANEELTRRSMERSPSMTMQAEKEDLKEAAEESYNVIMDLNLDGRVRWVSPSWDTVIGTSRDTIQGQPIADLLVKDKDAFQRAVETMKNDDSRSYKFRFSVAMGSMSRLSSDLAGVLSPPSDAEAFQMDEILEQQTTLTLEGQGILIYDRSTGEPSHTMWVVRPFVEPTEITIDLAPMLVESLGVGAGMLARYLTSLAEQGAVDPGNHPPPMPVLCRICERQIQPWWFEKHSELCMLEHKAESDVQLCQENLGMHRQAIVKVLDAMERRSTRPVSGEVTLPPPAIEYRGLPIGPSSSSSSGTASPGAHHPRSRDHSASGSRSRSFPARRPLVRIVELLLDLCDTALEISTPAIKDGYGTVELGTFRTQSPESEARINQVMQWQSPTTNTLDEEKGLALLCQDTEAAAKTKIEAVYRHRNTIEYSERIRLEFSMLVQDCIDEALRKATESSNEDLEDDYSDVSDDGDESIFDGSLNGALRRSNSILVEPGDRLRRHSFPSGSGTTSPMECSTPKSQQSLHRTTSRRTRYSHRSSVQFDNEGADSDTSAKSSLAAAIGHASTESLVSDQELTTRFSSRDHKRRSAFQPIAKSHSPKRQASPARIPPSSSPLRIAKPRASMYESMPTPITSPLLSTGDFSPALEHNFHHRRQSSATLSDQINKSGAPSSPRLSGVNPSQQNRAVPPSIKDFEIIKPISKGAFGSVYLSKKKSTGDYFAIKVLKKADMIAKNQVTNVRAERAIMMVQGESDFVAKLFWTFASKDYLYLVMEYLNGGDCAALIKVLGGLPEEWAKKYMAEVVLGLEHLHSRGIIHRDLKPDNLLIDQKGHLKLTDFGLSRMGLIGRQKRAQTQSSESTPDLLKQGPFSRSKSMASSRSTSFDYPGASPSTTPSIMPDSNAQLITPSYFSLNREGTLSRESSLRRSSNPRSDSGSEHLTTMLQNFNMNDPVNFSAIATRKTPTGDEDAQSESSTSSDFSALGLQHVTSHAGQSQVQQAPQSMMPPQLALFNPEDNNNRKFVGTPDYLAPETISGTGQDETSDWWSLGCILFEFLYGYPPFHADTPEQVFENILSRKIDWPEPEEDEASPEAKDIMNRLMCTDQTERLGVNGAEGVRKHPFFESLTWETLLEEEPQFVPTPQNPEDTEYFDSRGATLQSFVDEFDDQSTPSSTPGADLPERPHDAVSRVRKEINSSKRGLIPLSIPPHVREGRNRRLSEPVAQDDFGSFAFKNLPVLEKANKDVIQKLRTEALKSTPALATSNPPSPLEGNSINSTKPLSRALSNSSAKNGGKRPVSPSNHLHNSTSSSARVSQPSSPLLLSFTAGTGDKRKISNASASSSLSQQSNASSLQPGPFVETPRLPTATKSQSPSAPSPPMKTQPKVLASSTVVSSISTSPTKNSKDKQSMNSLGLSQRQSQQPASANPRVRSLTVGSADSETTSVVDGFRQQQKRRSQVFDMSPSSSDNEEVRGSALLRVQRRRQSARRMSNISFPDCPVYRPLDVLVCEDHPVSRMVMERLLEKLKCRTIMVENGAEAMRYAMGEVKFDIVLMEFKLPQINGEDVARMIRTSRNPNSSTPIVAVTGYLKDLSDPQHFDELMEKPATPSKLIDVLERQCFWKAPLSDRPTFGDRKESLSLSKPPMIPDKHGRMSPSVDQFMANGKSQNSTQFASVDGDSLSGASNNDPTLVSRTSEWDRLNLRSSLSLDPEPLSGNTSSSLLPPTNTPQQETAPTRLQSHAMERIPSPLSTHVSVGIFDNISSQLPPPPNLVPLPPSIDSTPVFGTPTVELLKSPLSRPSSPPATPLQRFQTYPPTANSLEGGARQKQMRSPSKEEKTRFSMLFSSSKERGLSDQDEEQSPSPPLDFKSKSKRSSLEKKKEKQCKEGLLGDEADADDEDSLTGGRKPSKSRSIGEMIRGVKKSPPGTKRTKSNEGRSDVR